MGVVSTPNVFLCGIRRSLAGSSSDICSRSNYITTWATFAVVVNNFHGSTRTKCCGISGSTDLNTVVTAWATASMIIDWLSRRNQSTPVTVGGIKVIVIYSTRLVYFVAVVASGMYKYNSCIFCILLFCINAGNVYSMSGTKFRVLSVFNSWSNWCIAVVVES